MTDTKVPAQPIKEGDLREVEIARVRYAITVPSSVPYEALLSTEYWSVVAKNKLRPGFMVEAAPADGSWLALLYVRDATDTGAVVAEVWRKDFDGAGTIAELDDYEAEHIDNVGWCVVNKRTGKRETEGLKTKQAAAGWIASRKGR